MDFASCAAELVSELDALPSLVAAAEAEPWAEVAEFEAEVAEP